MDELQARAEALLEKAKAIGRKHIPGDGDGDGIAYEGRGKKGGAKLWRYQPHLGDDDPHSVADGYIQTLHPKHLIDAANDKKTDWAEVASQSLRIEGRDSGGVWQKGVKPLPNDMRLEGDEGKYGHAQHVMANMMLMPANVRAQIAQGKVDFGNLLRSNAVARMIGPNRQFQRDRKRLLSDWGFDD